MRGKRKLGKVEEGRLSRSCKQDAISQMPVAKGKHSVQHLQLATSAGTAAASVAASAAAKCLRISCSEGGNCRFIFAK